MGLFVFLGCQQGSEFDPAKHFKDKCSICHQNSEMQRGPNLFGLNADYLVLQMEKFKVGIRGINPKNRSAELMASAKSVLPEGERLRILGAWLSAQQAPEFVYNLKGKSAVGKDLAQSCLACHRQKGLYPMPELLDLEPWYLLDQLRKFKQGWRGGHRDDLGGKIMQSAVQPFSDAELKKIVLYLQSLMLIKDK
jgi:cytochrome c553